MSGEESRRRNQTQRWLRIERTCQSCGAPIHILTIPERHGEPKRTVLINPGEDPTGWVVITDDWRTYVDPTLAMEGTARYARHRCHRSPGPVAAVPPAPVTVDADDEDEVYAAACAAEDRWLTRRGR